MKEAGNSRDIKGIQIRENISFLDNGVKLTSEQERTKAGRKDRDKLGRTKQ